MTNSAGAVHNGLVLRLSVPVSGELAALGPELATRLAEQLGVAAPKAAQVASAISNLSNDVHVNGANEMEFEFHKLASQLAIRARCEGRTAETRIPLTA